MSWFLLFTFHWQKCTNRGLPKGNEEKYICKATLILNGIRTTAPWGIKATLILLKIVLPITTFFPADSKINLLSRMFNCETVGKTRCQRQKIEVNVTYLSSTKTFLVSGRHATS